MFGIMMAIFFGCFHQAGVVQSLRYFKNEESNDTVLIYYKTYMVIKNDNKKNKAT
jgi:hypothetical protein